MRVVADTNVLVSAFLWSGIPHKLLTAAEAGRVTLYTSPAIIDELVGVLSRDKFTARLHELRVTPQELLMGYLKTARLVQPRDTPSIVKEDPEDNMVLACALTAGAEYLITGDSHLLHVESYHTIQIVSPRTFFSRVLS